VACAQAVRARPAVGDESVAAHLLAEALLQPMRTILRNAGWSEAGRIIAEAECRAPEMTFDVLSGAWVDAWQAGLVDPLAVLRTALEVSVSAARTAMKTGALVRRRQVRPPAGR
jgi:chaperonin GroEL